MTKRRRILLVLPAALLAGAAAAWLALPAALRLAQAGAGKSPETNAPKPGQGAKAPVVEVQPARVGEMARALELTGEVVATDAVVIAATSEGPIIHSPWREGDEVRTGEKLVEIEREVYRAEVRAAKAALAVAEARLADLKAGARPEEIEKAKADVARRQATRAEARKAYERQTRLIEKDFTSQQSVDQAREKVDVAGAELRAAQEALRMLKAGPTATEIAVQKAAVKEASAKLALAQARLAECVIAAPFDGRITRVHIRRGDLAAPRSPLIEMYAPASLVVRFCVPEAYAAAVRPGLRLEAALDALPGRTLAGEVVRAYPQLDSTLRTRTVEAKLAQTAELMPHQFARLTLELGSANEAVIIPAEAVTETPQGERIVFVVEAGKAARRKVALGIEEKQSVQVVKGVAPGEQVVVKGNENLKDGMPVRMAGAGEGRGKPERKGAAARRPEASEAGR